MSTILHIFKKDMKHFCWAWIALILLAIIEVFLFGTSIGFDDSKFISFLEFCSTVGSSLLGFVVIVLVVQQEPLVDPDSYWLTKPISRIHLLLAKALFILAFIILPSSLALCITLLLNDGSSRLFYGMTAILSPILWSLIWLFLAANTRSFPRFLLLLTILVIGFYACLFGIFFSGMDLGSGILPSDTPSHISYLIQILLWCVGISFSLFLIYTTRNLVKSWLPLLPALLLSLIMNPGDTFFGFSSTSGEINAELAEHKLIETGSYHENNEVYYQYAIHVRIENIALNEKVWAQINSVDVVNADGSTFEISNYEFNHGGVPLERISADVFKLPVANITTESRDKIREPFKLEANINFTTSGLEPRQTFPLAEGIQVKDNGNRLTVHSYALSGNELNVHVKGYLPDLPLEPKQIDTIHEPLGGLYFFEISSTEADWKGIPGITQYNYSFTGTSTKTTVEFDLPQGAEIDGAQLRLFKRSITNVAYVFLHEDNVVFSSGK